MKIYKLAFQIGGITTLIESKDSSFMFLLKKKYGDFLIKDDSKPYTRLVFSKRDFPTSRRRISIKRNNACFLIKGELFQGVFYPRKGFTQVVLDYEDSVISTFLRVFYSLLLAFNKGVLVHSLGVVKNNRGFLFIGPSSSGKTTAAKRLKDVLILSDELTCARMIDNKFYLFPTPFGQIRSFPLPNKGFLLHRLFFLDKKTGGYIREDRFNTFLKVLKSIFFLCEERVLVQKIVTLSKSMVYNFSAYRVNILTDKEPFKDIDNGYF